MFPWVATVDMNLDPQCMEDFEICDTSWRCLEASPIASITAFDSQNWIMYACSLSQFMAKNCVLPYQCEEHVYETWKPYNVVTTLVHDIF